MSLQVGSLVSVHLKEEDVFFPAEYKGQGKVVLAGFVPIEEKHIRFIEKRDIYPRFIYKKGANYRVGDKVLVHVKRSKEIDGTAHIWIPGIVTSKKKGDVIQVRTKSGWNNGQRVVVELDTGVKFLRPYNKRRKSNRRRKQKKIFDL